MITQHKKPIGPKEFTVMMALLMSLVAMTIDAILPALVTIGDAFEVADPNRVQFIIACVFIGMATGQMISGPLSDALGRKRLLYFSFSIYIIGSTVAFFAPSFEMILVGRFIQGIGVAGPYVSAVSIVRDKFAGRAMAKTMSLVMTIFILVPAIAPTLGQAVIYLGSWHSVFVLYIVYAIAVASWITLRLEETLPPERRIPFNIKNIVHGVKEVLSNRATVCYMFCSACVFGSFMGYLVTCPQVFMDKFGVGDSFVLYFGALALTLGGSSLVNSSIVEKFGMRYICLRALCVVILASAVFLAINYFVDVTLWIWMGYAAVLFSCFGMVFGNMNALAMEPMGHIAGIASAVIGAIATTTAITLGTSIGQMYDGSLAPIATGFVILASCAIGLILFAQPRGAQPSQV